MLSLQRACTSSKEKKADRSSRGSRSERTGRDGRSVPSLQSNNRRLAYHHFHHAPTRQRTGQYDCMSPQKRASWGGGTGVKYPRSNDPSHHIDPKVGDTSKQRPQGYRHKRRLQAYRNERQIHRHQDRKNRYKRHHGEHTKTDYTKEHRRAENKTHTQKPQGTMQSHTEATLDTKPETP